MGTRMNWTRLTLPAQFLFAGATVMTAAMLLVGFWVASRIEQAVVQNSAIAAALYMESFISPLSQELAERDILSEPAIRALEEIFQGTSLGERVVSYKIWKPGNKIVFASDHALIGKTFEPADTLKAAWLGKVAASYGDLNDQEDTSEASLGLPLLEVYIPIHEVWTGEIIAVAEFYERADALALELSDAHQKSWLVVGAAFATSGLLLFGIVQAGGRTIHRQRLQLEQHLAETERISEQNALLRQKAISANRRSTAETERAMRQVGFELHDGPAQYLALAALRLDAAFPQGTTGKDPHDIRASLAKALTELRAISRGLAVPDLDNLSVPGLVQRVIDDHENQTEMSVKKDYSSEVDCDLDYTQKLCLYRFLQEALSNAARHANVDHAIVRILKTDTSLAAEVRDEGPGFDPGVALKVRSDGGQGLLGLKDRAESIGGSLGIDSAPGRGTALTLNLSLERTMS